MAAIQSSMRVWQPKAGMSPHPTIQSWSPQLKNWYRIGYQQSNSYPPSNGYWLILVSLNLANFSHHAYSLSYHVTIIFLSFSYYFPIMFHHFPIEIGWGPLPFPRLARAMAPAAGRLKHFALQAPVAAPSIAVAERRQGSETHHERHRNGSFGEKPESLR